MSKVLLGNIKGPKGEKGDKGLAGDASPEMIEAAESRASAVATELIPPRVQQEVQQQNITGQVSAQVAAQVTPAVLAAGREAAVGALDSNSTVVDAAASAVTQKVANLQLVERFQGDPTVDWRWYFAYANGEVAFGQRTDGSWYPTEIGPSFADQSLAQLDYSQGWRFAVYYRDTREVAFGQRTDGSWYPESLGGVVTTKAPIRISGDSMTGGWAGYVAALGVLLGGKTVIAEGDGGRRSEWIAGRQGGQPWRVTSSTGKIPANGPVDVTVSVFNHIGATPPMYVVGNFTGVLGGIPGALTISDADTGAATFTRSAPGRESVLPAQTPFTRIANRGAWPIIWAGRNNFKLANDGAQIVRDVGDMLRWSTARDHALVLSIFPWEGEELGTGVRGTLDTVNGMLRDTYPVEFVDVAAQMRSVPLMLAVGITSEHADYAESVTNIANGLTPKAFRADQGHLNAKGYEALNLLISEAYAARGWNN